MFALPPDARQIHPGEMTVIMRVPISPHAVFCCILPVGCQCLRRIRIMDRQKPREDRPQMPGYGISHEAKGMLEWEWAEERLRESHNYWLATTRPDGRPHVFPIWGVWFE